MRRGRGFSYVDGERRSVTTEVRTRIQGLAIPPAWTDVWICVYEDGHLLAIGNDERGRRQYRYHDDWRTFRPEYRKADRVLLNLWSDKTLLWGDAGQGQFLIAREDLLKRDFNRVWYQWDCS